MNTKKSLKQKAFTLIELLVVVAIISLITSIVLAGLSEARNKARQSKFVQEIGQFIRALELYKTENGFYPGQPTEQHVQVNINSDGALINRSPTDFNLKDLLSSHIESIPYFQKTPIGNSWIYWANPTNLLSGNHFARCIGDTTIPPYVIMVNNNNTNLTFNNWSSPEIFTRDMGNWRGHSGYRCYSL